MRNALGAMLLACAVAAGCGGGGAAEEGWEDGLWVPDCVVDGFVRDTQGQPVAEAVVAVELDRVYSTSTDSAGHYRLALPGAYRYPPHFAGTVTRTSYVPQALIFTDTPQCPTVADAALELRPLSETDVVFEGGIGVTHLGDDVYNGTFNSQLQLPSSGVSWSDAFTYTEDMKSRYSRMCISFQARGVQSSVHKDTISLSHQGDVSTAQVELLKDSDPFGAYATASHCFSLEPYPAGARLDLAIRSGDGDGTLDDDDFEFVSVAGTLAP